MEHPASELLGSEEAEWAFEDEWETKKVEVDESVLSKKARRSCTFFTKVRITYGGATHVFARGAGGAGGTLMPRLFSIDDDGDGDGPRGRRWLVRVVDLWLDEDEGSAYYGAHTCSSQPGVLQSAYANDCTLARCHAKFRGVQRRAHRNFKAR